MFFRADNDDRDGQHLFPFPLSVADKEENRPLSFDALAFFLLADNDQDKRTLHIPGVFPPFFFFLPSIEKLRVE